MSLPLLLSLVVSGIAGIAALLHLLGLSAQHRFDDDAAARDAWLREFPGSDVRHVTRARNGHAALIDSGDGPGLVWPMGADCTARPLSGARVERTPQGLTIRLPDYTAPRIRLKLDRSDATGWARHLKDTT